MTAARVLVTGGVDTHGATHHAAVVDQVGRVLGDRQFAVSAQGYRALLAWMRSFGQLVRVGVEGTGAYGAGLARYLTGEGVEVVEVDRPTRHYVQRRTTDGLTKKEIIRCLKRYVVREVHAALLTDFKIKKPAKRS